MKERNPEYQLLPDKEFHYHQYIEHECSNFQEASKNICMCYFGDIPVGICDKNLSKMYC